LPRLSALTGATEAGQLTPASFASLFEFGWSPNWRAAGTV
jgi:hypothetical protein